MGLKDNVAAAQATGKFFGGVEIPRRRAGRRRRQCHNPVMKSQMRGFEQESRINAGGKRDQQRIVSAQELGQAFDAEWSTGRAATLEAAVACALGSG